MTVSSKRNRNKKAWTRKRKRGERRVSSRGVPRTPRDRVSRPALELRRSAPTELDQIGVVIVEEQLGLSGTDLDGLRAISTRLPYEPCMSLLSILAGHVEETMNRPDRQLEIAEGFFGASELVERYRELIRGDETLRIFAPQSLYTLMRVLIDEAYDAPVTDDLPPEERLALMEAVVASNSVIERGLDTTVGPTREGLLAYELQVGHYYSRPNWLEEMARARELYRLATEDPDLIASPDFVPVKDWIERSGLTAEEQWLFGFGLSGIANAWDETRHPHVPPATVAELLERTGLADRAEAALAVISADREALQRAFAELHAHGKRFMWELRPFNTSPFLRLKDNRGLVLLGRPWILSWLGEGFHYRAIRVAQAEDAAESGGRTDHVQRYTAFAGQVFEKYCLSLAEDGLPAPAVVMGEQQYGRGGGQKTSDVAVIVGEDLVLFEVNARRVGAEPLLTGDPLDASNELTKLLVKKINQLGVSVAALLSSDATLPGIDVVDVKRIFPVVVAAGRLWQTSNLWGYLDHARDPDKCKSFDDDRVQPLQVLDVGEYEQLLTLAHHGSNLPDLIARKTSGPYRHRDLAVWLNQDPQAPDSKARLPAIEATFDAMMAALKPVFAGPA
jgi:hypothetical protein